MPTRRPAESSQELVEPAYRAAPVYWQDKRGREWAVIVTWSYVADRLAPVGVEVRSYRDSQTPERPEWIHVEAGRTGLADVTRELYKGLPLASLLDESRRNAVKAVRARAVRTIEVDEQEQEWVVVDDRALGFLEAEKAARTAKRAGQAERDAKLEERHKLVAVLYRIGLDVAPREPAKYVYEQLRDKHGYRFGRDDSGRDQVRKWIAMSRRAGHLPSNDDSRTSR